MGQFDTLRSKVEKMVDDLSKKPDLTPVEIKNATDAMCLLEKLNKVERGDAMRDEFGSYGTYYGVPYPDMYAGGYGDNYGRRVRSSTTGRFMNGPTSGQTMYGHSIPDRMVASLEDMMDQAHNDYERQEIQKEINRIRQNSNMM